LYIFIFYLDGHEHEHEYEHDQSDENELSPIEALDKPVHMSPTEAEFQSAPSSPSSPKSSALLLEMKSNTDSSFMSTLGALSVSNPVAASLLSTLKPTLQSTPTKSKYASYDDLQLADNEEFDYNITKDQIKVPMSKKAVR
jgi:hypothetical protein